MLGALTDAAPFIRQSVAGMIEAGGKMLRPALVVIGGLYGGKSDKRLYSLAAAIELLHTATLVHDDILDDAPTRRGRRTIHADAGAKAAVLIGDYLFARCFSLMSEATGNDTGLNAARVVERICEGEIQQSRRRYSLNQGMRAYRRRIAAKTAALIAASLSLGARQGECAESEVAGFRRIGYDLGMGFQIVDDLLDFNGETATTGKPVARDLAAGIFTVPVIHALNARDGEELRDLLSRPPYSEETLALAAALVRSGGGIEAGRAMAADYTDHAIAGISSLEPGAARDYLLRLAEELLHRSV